MLSRDRSTAPPTRRSNSDPPGFGIYPPGVKTDAGGPCRRRGSSAFSNSAELLDAKERAREGAEAIRRVASSADLPVRIADEGQHHAGVIAPEACPTG